VFERGETLRLGEEIAPDEPVGEVGDPTDAVHISLGEYGVVTLEATDPVGFEEATVSMAEVLASIAAVALERADREQDLLCYRTVIENVQDMVYVRDTAGRFSLVTDPLADWLGRDREALVGAALADLLPASEVPAVEGVVDQLREEDDSGASERVETEFVGADGQAWPAELEVSLVPSDGAFAGTVGVVRDRSELAETRELLETERDRFSYLFDNLPDAVVESELDADDRPVVRTVNDAFTEVFGYDAEEVVGDSINEHVLPEGEHEAGRELDRQTAAGERPRCEVRRRTANGLREFLLRGIPYETGDGTIRSFGIYTDITARKQRERRLEVLNRVLRHNIRNDVNVILGHAEVLADRVEDDDFATRAAELREKAAELTALSDRARSLDRTMRRGSPRDSIVGLATLVDDVVAGYDREYSALTVETAVADVRVVGDGRLALAVEELLDNVVEHAGAGSTVRVESEGAGEDIRLRVADDGPGIPDHERSAVGGSTEITQLEHGSGLGLWVVRWVCESCGGRLRFGESDLGGAAVVLSLTGADD
jgi:PAS domain S-box-containing protein